MMKKRRNLKRTVLAAGILIIGLALILFSYTFWVIYKGVKTACLKAQNEYQEECVSSLIKYVQSEDYPLRKRNAAIWALGQLADKKALPFLYTLERSLPEQEKCGYDDYLCKYEVEKAIK